MWGYCTWSFTYAQNDADKYINPDVTAVYSTHPERPFRYGFPLERNDILKLYDDPFNAYGISSGDVVAEVGAASGWLEGVLSVISDSVTYYIQDIDTNSLNKEQFDAVVDHFSAQRQTAQTNNFHFVIGTETSTNLPEAYFDLIIINNTFHHFSEVAPMMDDIAKKLKPDGRLVISESFANDDMKVRHGGCNKKAYTVSTVEGLLEPSGLYLTNMEYPEYSTYNYLTFTRNKEKGLKYRERMSEIAPLLSDLNSLNSKKVCRNKEKMSSVQDGLQENFETILEHFPSLDKYFHFLANEYIKSKKRRCAIRVLETCCELFPDDPKSSVLLADANYESGRYGLSIEYYEIAAGLDPAEMEARVGGMLSYLELELFNDAFYDYQMALMVDSTDDFLHSYAGELFLAIEESEIHHPFNARVRTKDTVYEISLDRDDLLIYALESYSDAIKFNPLIPYYYISRAGIHEKLDNYERALEDYDYAIYLNPNDYKVYKLRAETKLQLGNEEGYEEDIDRSKSVKKQNKKKRKFN